MDCPDCKVSMEWHDTFIDGIPCAPYWKCPKCLIEIDDTDED